MNFEDVKCIYEADKKFEWRKWMLEIPYLRFPPHWLVKAIPPFNTGIIRYWIRTDAMPEKACVSIYLDCYDQSGCVGQPYWEVYPVDGDCERCFLNETDELLAIITRSIEQQEKR